MKRFFILLLIIILSACARPLELKSEKDFQRYWCDKMGGQVEYVLPDSTRVDCLLRDYAVEVDFGKKWAEAVGQSLYYAEITGRDPGILLILADDEERFLRRAEKASAGVKKNVKIWTIKK